MPIDKIAIMHTPPPFQDRVDAGRKLADQIEQELTGSLRPIILALPRGGVPVAHEIASRLDAPLDILVVRKVGLPGQPEYAIGAIASGGVQLLNEPLIKGLGISPDDIQQIVQQEQRELSRREQIYRGNKPALGLKGEHVILVDDGMATGYTMQAAVQAVRQHQPGHLSVAVPVASAEACTELLELADQVICLNTPHPFRAVGLWYRHFSQTSDAEVRQLLGTAEK